jgi:hypothetical protein
MIDRWVTWRLADYELRDQKVNGIGVIEKSGMQNQSIIVTSAYVSRIKDFSEKSKSIKIFSVHKRHSHDL